MRHRIHVPLLSNPAVYREADAHAAGEGRFRLAGGKARAEALQFRPGEVVECSIQTLPDGSKGLVATRSVSADPEYRSRLKVFGVSGAIVGAVLGAAVALSLDLSSLAMAIGAVVGAPIFAYCSVRWGDSAWESLVRVLGE